MPDFVVGVRVAARTGNILTRIHELLVEPGLNGCRSRVLTAYRARVIADQPAVLDGAAARRVEAALLTKAGRLTSGQLRAACLQAVFAVDPGAARRRREQAQREARVEKWREPSGTASLAGRDLPPAGVLAADKRIDMLARQLKKSGAEASLDQLRAGVYVALLTGTPIDELLATPAEAPAAGHETGPEQTADPAQAASPEQAASPQQPADPAQTAGPQRPADPAQAASPEQAASPQRPADPAQTAGPAPTAGPGHAASPGQETSPGQAAGPGRETSPGQAAGPGRETSPGQAAGPGQAASAEHETGAGGQAGLAARVNLTLPLATLLGLSQAPGDVGGFGPVDAATAAELAALAAADPASRWCLTLTGPKGEAIGHGCAPPGRAPSGRARPPDGTHPGHPGPGSPGSTSRAPGHTRHTRHNIRRPRPARQPRKPRRRCRGCWCRQERRCRRKRRRQRPQPAAAGVRHRPAGHQPRQRRTRRRARPPGDRC